MDTQKEIRLLEQQVSTAIDEYRATFPDGSANRFFIISVGTGKG